MSAEKDEKKPPRRPGRPSQRRAVKEAAASAFDRIDTALSGGQLHGQTALPTEESSAKTAKTNAPIRSMTVRLYDRRDSEALDKWMTNARGRVDGRPSFDRLAREMIRILSADPVISALVIDRMAEKNERPAGSRKRPT